MKFHKLFLVSALCLSAAVAVAAEPFATVVQVTEGQILYIEAKTLHAPALESDSLRVTVNPNFGELVAVSLPPLVGSEGAASETASLFAYQPHDSFLGIERLEFSALSAASGAPVTLNLEIRVIPGSFPVSGRFFLDGDESLGLYRQHERKLELCSGFLGADQELVCSLHTVKGAGGGWWPVYGDWDGDGVELPSLFDPATATLYQVRMIGKELRIGSPQTFPGLEWSFPTAGDWDGQGFDQPAFVTMDGRIHRRPIDPEDDRFEVPFAADFGDLSSPQFPWVVRWPLSDRDAVGVIDSKDQRLRWISTASIKSHDDPLAVAVKLPWLVPFQSEAAVGASGPIPKMFGLRLTPWQGEGKAVYWLTYVSMRGKPATMPLKFPNDPPDL